MSTQDKYFIYTYHNYNRTQNIVLILLSSRMLILYLPYATMSAFNNSYGVFTLNIMKYSSIVAIINTLKPDYR